MKNFALKKISILLAVLSLTGLFACGGGESSLQDKLYDELKAVSDGKWECYEAVEQEGTLNVKIEVDYVVDFQEGKKALEVVKKLAPQAKGMIDFTNAQTGMVVRKVPIE
jgi:hypothetical protein